MTYKYPPLTPEELEFEAGLNQDHINRHLNPFTQKKILEEAIDLHRANLREINEMEEDLRVKKEIIMRGLLYSRREHLRVERDIQNFPKPIMTSEELMKLTRG